MTLRYPCSASEKFLIDLENAGLPAPIREYRFHSVRRWKLDYAWPEEKLAVELEGGVSDYKRGRHIRAEGFQCDLNKYNTLVLSGWRLLRFTTADFQEGRAVDDVRAALKKEPPPWQPH